MPSMHARFSRWIGPLPEDEARSTAIGWIVLAIIGAGLLFVLLVNPTLTLSVLAAVDAVSLWQERQWSQRVRAAENDRANENIGSFARAFDRRAANPLDPWAIRAVWNAIAPLTESKGQRIPLRPSDRLDDELGIDPEEVEYLIPKLVEQCERVPENWTVNPYYSRLRTLADLVHLISAQPLRQSV